jgi:hypothetical protein
MSDSYCSTTTTEDSDNKPETKDENITITFTRSEPCFIDLNKTTCKLYGIPFDSNLHLLKRTINVNFAINDPVMSLRDTWHDRQILTASNKTITALTTFQFFCMGAAMVSVQPSYEHSAFRTANHRLTAHLLDITATTTEIDNLVRSLPEKT